MRKGFELPFAHSRNLWGVPSPAYSSFMVGYVCVQCECEEGACKCERYCWLCQGWESVRLCVDGRYYCANCREACDMTPQS